MRQPSDERVVLTPGHSRYQLVTDSPTWIYHSMDTGKTLDGLVPNQTGKTAVETEPTMTRARADFGPLEHGGLFVLPCKYSKGMEVLATFKTGTVTFTAYNPTTNTSRPMGDLPTTGMPPFVLAAGEYVKALGTGTVAGILVRELPIC